MIVGEYRYTYRNAVRYIAGVDIPCGTIVDKWDGGQWVYLDTLPPGERYHEQPQV